MVEIMIEKVFVKDTKSFCFLCCVMFVQICFKIIQCFKQSYNLTIIFYNKLSHNVVSEQVRYKPSCTVTEEVEISDFRRGIVLPE